MHFAWVLIFLISWNASAHEVQSITQHVWLQRQKKSGWLQALRARADVKRNFAIGAEGIYLERFSLTDKQVGAFTLLRPSDRWTVEIRYHQGKGNKILPQKQSTASAWYSLRDGLSPFVIYRDSRYSLTTLHAVNVGIEVETIPHFIFVPMVMRGRATFFSPGKTEDVYSHGIRVIYYTENKFSLAAFGSKGKEAAQGIIGRSTILVDTLSAGVAGTWYFSPDFKGELIVDQTDYDQLKTQFTTTTLNLTWMF